MVRKRLWAIALFITYLVFIMKEIDIAALQQALEEATAAYEAAKETTGAARLEEAEALSRLNQAQRAFDTAVANLKQRAPAGSNWDSKTPPPPRIERITG